jgi:hypothetical protein
LLDVWMTNAEGQRADTVAHGESLRLHASIEAMSPVTDPGIALWVTNEDNVRVFSVGARQDGGPLSDLEPGERIEVSFETPNLLAAGRYHIGCGVVRGTAGLDVLLYHDRAADIVSYGAEILGLIEVPHSASVSRTSAAEPETVT